MDKELQDDIIETAFYRLVFIDESCLFVVAGGEPKNLGARLAQIYATPAGCISEAAVATSSINPCLSGFPTPFAYVRMH